MNTTPKALVLAHEWSIQAYRKGAGLPCNIDGSRANLEAELRRLYTLNEQMLVALTNYYGATNYRAAALVSGGNRLAHADAEFWRAHDDAFKAISAAKEQP